MLTEPEAAGICTSRIQCTAGRPRVAVILFAVAGLVWVVSVPQTYPTLRYRKIARRRVAREERYEQALLRWMVTENLQSAQRLCNSKILREMLIQNIGAAEGRVGNPDLHQADLNITIIDHWSGIRQEGIGPRAATISPNRIEPHQLIRTPLAPRSVDALSAELKEAAMQDFYFTHPAVLEYGNAS